MKRLLPFFMLAVLASSCGPAVSKYDALYLDPDAPLEDRVEDALSRMTTEEKIAIIHAQSKFSSPGVARLGIPELWCTDGPHGIRPEVLWDEWDQAGWTCDSCVAFPALTCLAATWNRDMAALYGKSIGEEALYRGKDVLLGPGVNMARTPLNGRNFEYMGEDPFLAGEMVIPYVQNVQKNGVATCVKHYCLNNEESHRHTIDVDVDDRTLYEIYLPAFKAAVVKGGSWSIMGAYNLYRGEHLCHNSRLINDVLKGEWGFDGAVISDWGGCHDTEQAIKNGLDIEFGTWTDGLRGAASDGYSSYFLANPYLELINEGKVGTEELDDKARRVLRLIMRTAMRQDKGSGALCSEAHYAAARKIGDEGMVLLRNEGNLLPLKAEGKILVVGENAIKAMTVGGGSSSLKVQKEISPLDGIKARVGSDAEVVYARGYVGDVTSSYNRVVFGADLSESRSAEELLSEALSLAAEADEVIFVGGLNKSDRQDCEGIDRNEYNLPYGQGEIIEALAKVNPNLAVVLVSGNPVGMPWVEQVPAILQAWYLGSEAGESIADVLFGDVNPSGKLPFTYPVLLEDSPAHYQGRAYPDDGKSTYPEGIFIGYRWFEHMDIKPLFAFGHGLSYTTFEYGQAKISSTTMKKDGSVTVSVDVRNSGSVAGAEVVQLYVADLESSVERPVKELKGFEKVMLQEGESARVSFTITPEHLSFYDEQTASWKAESGEFELMIGSSSDDIRTSVRFSLK